MWIRNDETRRRTKEGAEFTLAINTAILKLYATHNISAMAGFLQNASYHANELILYLLGEKVISFVLVCVCVQKHSFGCFELH